ncbi:hypothetical protein KC726_02840 [Candidatus Woesebacteria bacterium]|nr:hypothetical protein [Candidatus Woesebacteria bacterium]
MAVFVLVIAIVSIVFLGLLTYTKNPKSATNKLFLFFTLTVATYLFANYLATIPFNDITTLFFIRTVMTLASFINLFFFLLANTIPNANIPLSKPLLILSIIWTLFMVYLTQSNLVFSSLQPNTNIPNPGIGMPIFLAHTIIYLLGGVATLIKRYISAEGLEKNQLKFVMFGATIMLMSIFITNFLIVILFKTTNFVNLLPIYTLIFIALTSYSIIRHRFLDLRLVVARSVAYLSLIFIAALIYSGLLIGLNTFITKQQINYSNITISIAFMVVAVLAFQTILSYIEKATDKIFFRDHYDENELLWSLSHIMASTLNLTKLTDEFLKSLLEQMKISYGAVVLLHDSSIVWVGSQGSVSQHAFHGKDIVALIHKSSTARENDERLLVFEELSESANKQKMRDHNITIVIPLTVRNKLIGGILLGEKASGEIYSSEDINVLKILAPEIAVAVRNALSFEEIRKFNITLEEEVKRATSRLRHANKRLKELDQLKDEFVSIASHELRTPMTAIKSYLWMALNKGKKLSPDMQKYLDISYKSTERLIHLVNDMLTVSRIERNKIAFKMEETDIVDILNLIKDELAITAQEKHIDFTFSYGTKKLMVKGDQVKLREVYQNIIGNALKFTPEKGTIEVNADEKGNMVVVTISDTGSGIPKEDMGKLFQKFSKIEYSYSKHSSQPGTGLGLYISKQIVSLHGGDIEVQSVVDKGTTFTVLLPKLHKK